MGEQLKDFMLFYGYTNHPDVPDEENKTAFFQMDLEEGDLDKYRGYAKHNKQALAAVTAPDYKRELFLFDAKNEKQRMPAHFAVNDPANQFLPTRLTFKK